MGEQPDIFNLRILEEHELGHLEYILNSPSYERIFKPYLQRIRDSLNMKILDPSRRRQDDYPDDFIRGGIVMADGFLSFFNKLIEETQIERAARTQQPLNSQDEYEQMRVAGLTRPAGQTLQPDERVYDPSEDY